MYKLVKTASWEHVLGLLNVFPKECVYIPIYLPIMYKLHIHGHKFWGDLANQMWRISLFSLAHFHVTPLKQFIILVYLRIFVHAYHVSKILNIKGTPYVNN